MYEIKSAGITIFLIYVLLEAEEKHTKESKHAFSPLPSNFTEYLEPAA